MRVVPTWGAAVEDGHGELGKGSGLPIPSLPFRSTSLIGVLIRFRTLRRFIAGCPCMVRWCPDPSDELIIHLVGSAGIPQVVGIAVVGTIVGHAGSACCQWFVAN